MRHSKVCNVQVGILWNLKAVLGRWGKERGLSTVSESAETDAES